MRILFLCGSLEPAKDGVGDYVRSLATLCLRHGHECRMIALNDIFVTEPAETTEPMAGTKLTSLRMPQTISWPERVKLARAFRDRFQPDWVSLQFVGYGMNEKGIVAKLVPHFQAMVSGLRVHIMFHELWIGMPPAALFKHRAVGAWQLWGVKKLFAGLKPHLVTTSNSLYIEALKRIGVSASLLPLYGNIPVVDRSRDPDFPGWLGDLGIHPAHRHQWWLGLFFGGLYPEWKPEPFLGILRRAAQKAGKRICLLSLGRPGEVGKEVWDKLREDYPDLSLPVLGEQPAEIVSILMQVADFGVAASPWDLIGKSGSAAAMIEHGLPVIVTRQDRQSRFPVSEPPSTDPLFHLCDDALESKLIPGLPKQAPRARREEIALRFCALLEQS
jgi:glycosyltransferase involved in cell wall biosynthesis